MTVKAKLMTMVMKMNLEPLKGSSASATAAPPVTSVITTMATVPTSAAMQTSNNTIPTSTKQALSRPRHTLHRRPPIFSADSRNWALFT